MMMLNILEFTKCQSKDRINNIETTTTTVIVSRKRFMKRHTLLIKPIRLEAHDV